LNIAFAALAASAIPAVAADLYVPSQPLPIIADAGFDWSGAYIGAALGVQGVRVLTDIEGTTDGSGALGGVFAGYTWQQGNVVFGAEIDAEYSGFDRTVPSVPPAWSFNTHVRGQGSLRARLGYAVDTLLFYGTAGLAVAHVGGSTISPTGTVYTDSDVRFGWTIGAGIETAFNQNWFARAEYRYTDLGARDMMFDLSYPGVVVRSHAVRIGVGYRF
jgi:outer membrane immunogenic protein